MSARALLVLTTGAALLIAGCSSGVAGSAAPAASSSPAPPSTATSSAPPSTSTQPATSSSPATSSQSATAEKSAAGAVARYETYLHAVGKQDLATACEIAAPAAKKAQDEGWGPCEQTFPMMFQMISPAQKKALQSATVDRARVTEDSSTKVEIPAAAVRAAVKFTDSDLGDVTLEYRGGQWFVTD
ncbi:hypothetical protein [Amycolatopsis sp. DSM 110486]|uniref:hypothetical protein n=1 Tax=Amycolatopsis sp. DSM 110486 TaxID=2865832 RepID=UPI001C6A16E8|nr:hypothetical protein [Amycolatopsis sp. DSM 110486]QYN23937.1 hypothetical protein K1T34_16695 [Amycolatopsis sp. DSM 110486]